MPLPKKPVAVRLQADGLTLGESQCTAVNYACYTLGVSGDSLLVCPTDHRTGQTVEVCLRHWLVLV